MHFGMMDQILFGISNSQQLVEPIADERERAMGFSTWVSTVPTLLEVSRQQMLEQAMVLNRLTFCMAE